VLFFVSTKRWKLLSPCFKFKYEVGLQYSLGESDQKLEQSDIKTIKVSCLNYEKLVIESQVQKVVQKDYLIGFIIFSLVVRLFIMTSCLLWIM
jgi:hypothetical protein